MGKNNIFHYFLLKDSNFCFYFYYRTHKSSEDSQFERVKKSDMIDEAFGFYEIDNSLEKLGWLLNIRSVLCLFLLFSKKKLKFETKIKINRL